MNCNRRCQWNRKKETCVYTDQENPSDMNSAPDPSTEKDYGIEAMVKNRVKQSFVFGMIDAYRGAQTFELPLISLNGGYNLTFKISYDSSQTTKGTMGIGWSHCFEKKLVVEEDSAYLYERPNIYHQYRRWEHDTLFWGRTMGYYGYQLFESSDGYRLECNNMSTEYYDFKGNLIKIKDRNGRELRFSHRENQTIITDLSTMKILYLEFDEPGKLIRIFDAKDRTVEFNYDGDQLTEILDVNGNHHFYVYDESGRMISECNDEHLCLYKNTYDEEGRVIYREDGMNQASTFVYSDNNRIITDRNGNPYQLSFNQHGLLASRTDCEGNTYTFTYTVNGNLETITDPCGNKETIEYLGYYKPWRYTDKNGNRTEFSYERDNISKITYSDGSMETFSWDYKNLLVEHCDLRGTITTFSYDDKRNLISKKIGQKKTFHYEYEDGLLISETDAKGYIIRFKYNKFGQMVARVDAAGRPTTYEYDLSGKLLKTTDPIGSSQTYTYNCNDLLASVIDAKGNCTTYLYDNNLNLQKIIFADGTSILLEYDAENRLTRELNQEGEETNYIYDRAGRLLSICLPSGELTEYQYDALGNIIKKTKNDGTETVYTYDAAGNLLTATDHKNNTIRYQYDHFSRIIREVNIFGGSTFFGYSSVGDLLYKTDPFGHKTVYTYDDYGNQTSVCDPRGNTTRYIYDNNDNILVIIDPFENATYYEYNSYNWAIKKTNQKNQREQYLYDAVGRFIGMTDAKENFINIFYDIAGNLRTFRDARRNEIFNIQYDSMNRPECSVDVFGNKTTYQYDKAGRLKAWIDPNGTVQSFLPSPENCKKANQGMDTRKIVYDLAGRIASYENSDDSVSITYDENGNIKTVADKTGISYRQYDALNRLIQYTAPDGQTVSYRYDPVGNMTAIIYPDQSEVLYNYDANNNLISVTDWAGRTTWYVYDANNRVIGISKPNGHVVTLIYDEAGQLISKDIGTINDESYSSFTYEYDKVGRIKSETDIVKNQTKCYCYDEQSRVISITVTDADGASCEHTFNYDENGNLTVVDGGEIFVYDSENKLIAHNGESVTYDRNANVLAATINGKEWTFQYDNSNRLISANADQYYYDAENNCICIQSGKMTKKLFYDGQNGKRPLMLTVNGVVTKFVYGLGLIGTETNDEFQTYLFDQYGNTIAVADQKQIKCFDRDVFGKYYSNEDTPLPLCLNKGYHGYIAVTDRLYFKNALFCCDMFSRPLNQNLLPPLF